MGMDVRQAAKQAMIDLRDLGGDYIGVMNLIAMDAEGNHVGFTSKKGRTYVYQESGMETYAEVEREFVEIPERWKTKN